MTKLKLPYMPDSLLPPISAEDKQKAAETLAKPLDSFPQKNAPKKGKTFITLVLFLVMLTGIIVPSYLVLQKNQQVSKQGESKQVVVDTTNQDIKKLVEEAFVYTGEGSTNYYSPSLDAAFTIDVSLLRISESTKSIFLYPKTGKLFTGNEAFAEVSINTENPYTLAKEYYDSFDKFVASPEEAKEGYKTFTITYESKSLFGSKEIESVKKIYYYKAIEGEDAYAYLVSTSYNQAEIAADIEAQYQKIITSLEYKPENAPSTASLTIPDVSAMVTFDRKTWEVTSQYSSYANFTLFESDYNAPYLAVNIRGGKITAEEGKENEYVQKIAEQEISYAKENKTGFTQTATNEAVTLGTKSFTRSAYSYKTSTETVYSEVFYTLSEDKKYYIEVVTYRYIDLGRKETASYKNAEVETLIKGISFEAKTNENVLGENTLNIEEPALVGKLGTVHIANTTCATFTINDPQYLPKISGTSREYCSAGLGTGFFVTPTGYIVTNAHVASGDPFTGSTELFLSTKGELFLEVFKEIARQILLIDPNALQTNEEIQELAILTQKYILVLIGEGKITASNIEYNNYMELDTPFDWDFDTKKLKNPDDYAKLDLVKANTLESPLKHIGKLLAEDKDPNSEPYQYTVADLALLKVASPEGTYPSIELGNEATLLEGSSILAIGFPGVADDSSLFAESSSKTATITRGAISAIKDSPTKTYKLIQTDAAINHGNSGGPIINNDSEVVAVSTYLVSGGEESDNYGAGISVGEIRNFLQTASIQPTESIVSQTILTGIDNMQKKYYKVAIADFDRAVQSYPKSEELVRPLKLLAQEKITAGEDNSPIMSVGEFNIHPSDTPVLIGGLGAAFVALIVLLIVVIRKKPKARAPQATAATPVATAMPTFTGNASGTGPLDPKPGSIPGITTPEFAVESSVAPVLPPQAAQPEPTIAAMEKKSEAPTVVQLPSMAAPEYLQPAQVQPMPTPVVVTQPTEPKPMPVVQQSPTVATGMTPTTPPQVFSPEPVLSTPTPTLQPMAPNPIPPTSPVMP